MTRYGPLGRLGRYTATHFRVVALAWVIVAVGLGAFAPKVEHALSGAGWEATGSQSVAAREAIDRDFGGLSSSALMVVVHSESKTSDDPPSPRSWHRRDRSWRPTSASAGSSRRSRAPRSRATAAPPSSRPAPRPTPTRWSAPPTI